VGGFDVQSEALKVRSIIGVIGEGTELARPFWTPMEYLRFFSRLQGGSDGDAKAELKEWLGRLDLAAHANRPIGGFSAGMRKRLRSEEHTSELQSRFDLVCRLLLEKKKYSSRISLRGRSVAELSQNCVADLPFVQT